jgi:hypothetical protein
MSSSSEINDDKFTPVDDKFIPGLMGYILRRELKWNLNSNSNYLKEKILLQSNTIINSKDYFNKLLNLANSYKPNPKFINKFSKQQIEGIYGRNIGKSNSGGSCKRIATFNKNHNSPMIGNSVNGGNHNCIYPGWLGGCWGYGTSWWCGPGIVAQGESCYNGTWCWSYIDGDAQEQTFSVNMNSVISASSNLTTMAKAVAHQDLYTSNPITGVSCPSTISPGYAFSFSNGLFDCVGQGYTFTGD